MTAPHEQVIYTTNCTTTVSIANRRTQTWCNIQANTTSDIKLAHTTHLQQVYTSWCQLGYAHRWPSITSSGKRLPQMPQYFRQMRLKSVRTPVRLLHSDVLLVVCPVWELLYQWPATCCGVTKDLEDSVKLIKLKGSTRLLTLLTLHIYTAQAASSTTHVTLLILESKSSSSNRIGDYIAVSLLHDSCCATGCVSLCEPFTWNCP